MLTTAIGRCLVAVVYLLEFLKTDHFFIMRSGLSFCVGDEPEAATQVHLQVATYGDRPSSNAIA